MRSFALLASLSSLLFAHNAASQLVTTTLPWLNGNTEVLQISTDALGDPVTATISTITAPGAGAATTTPTTALTTTGLTTALAKTTAALTRQKTTATTVPGNGVTLT